MYARSTTFNADPQRIDAAIPYVRDVVMPTITAMDDCLGLSMLCDRGSGRCIVTTSWRSEEGMRVTRDRVRAMRDRAGEMMGGTFDVQEWEIGLVHRTHHARDGAWARVTWTRCDPARMEDVLGTFRSAILPRLDDLQGFCSISLMMDRQSGMCAVTSVYADRESVHASAEDVRAMREQSAQELGIEVLDMAEMEVAIHSLRVPEMV